LDENLSKIDYFSVFENYQFDRLKDASVLITGASGFIGSVILKILGEISLSKQLNIKLIALSRRPIKKGNVAYTPCVKSYCKDVRKPVIIPWDVDYIIHCASVTDSITMKNNPVDTFLTCVEGTKNILDLARTKKVRSMVFISSMEVYGADAQNPSTWNNSGSNGSEDHYVTEDMLGYINLKNPRASYPEGKRAAEFLCNAYYSEFGVPVKITSLAQTFGPGVSPSDERVFAQFARSVVNNEDIVLHTDGSSDGNYCHIYDTVAGILAILLKGADGETYNVANEELHMTVRQMAEFVAGDIAKGRIRVVYDIPDDKDKFGYPPPVKLSMSSEKLRHLGWKPRYNMNDMYSQMIDYWKGL